MKISSWAREPGQAGDLEPIADRDGLDRLDREDRLPQLPSRRSCQETCDPRPGTSPKARTSNTPPSDSFSLRSRLISATIALPASGSRQRTGDSSTSAKSAGLEVIAARSDHARDLDHVREHAHARGPQKRLGDRAAGHPRRGLAGAGALEDVADVGQPVLLDADEIGVPGTRQVHLGQLGVNRPRVHALLPVGVVAVGDLQGDRTAQGSAVAHAAGHVHLVALDLHPPAASVAELAPRQIPVQALAIELEPGGKTLDDAGQSRPVRLARGCQVQRHRPKRDATSLSAGGCPTRPATPGRRSRGCARPCPGTTGTPPDAAHRPVRRSACRCHGRACRFRRSLGRFGTHARPALTA